MGPLIFLRSAWEVGLLRLSHYPLRLSHYLCLPPLGAFWVATVHPTPNQYPHRNHPNPHQNRHLRRPTFHHRLHHRRRVYGGARLSWWMASPTFCGVFRLGLEGLNLCRDFPRLLFSFFAPVVLPVPSASTPSCFMVFFRSSRGSLSQSGGGPRRRTCNWFS